MGATDPVAVVSLLKVFNIYWLRKQFLFKDLGASKTLSTLIEGESLVNDGSAMVLFEVILGSCEGKQVTFGH